MRTKVLAGLLALAGLAGRAGLAPPVAAQEATAEVRTWSGESWRLFRPSLEVFFTIMEKGRGGGGPERTQSIESSVTSDILERAERRESEMPEPKQGHRRSEVVTFFREGVEVQIPFARIKSLQFFRQPVEKSPLPPYLAAKHFRYFATAELVDGSHVEADYVNLGTTVLRGMTPQGRVDIPWEEVENVHFRLAGVPYPTAEPQKVALVSAVAAAPPRVPERVRQDPIPEVPIIPKAAIREEEVTLPPAIIDTESPAPAPETPAPPKEESGARPPAIASVPAPAPATPAPPTQEVPPPGEAPEGPQPAREKEMVALRSPLAEPPVPIPKVPEPPGRDVVFDFTSLVLNDDATVALNDFGEWLKANPDAKIVMQGHCDERERGTIAYNFALGELRLRAIRDHLVALGIAEYRISTAGPGEGRSALLGRDEPAWQCNRRVYLTVGQGDGPLR